jgi:hypothetical protein
MASKFPGGRLEIMPACLGSINFNDPDLRFLNSFTGMRFCQCSVEILYQPVQGVEKRLYRDEQLCYITEFPDDGIANAIGLQFKSPFYVDANCLLVPTAKPGGIAMDLAAQYEVRFRFAVQDQKYWLPMSLHQLFGLDPSQWQPTADLNNGFNPSLWARRCFPLASIGHGHESALYRIRVEYNYSGTEALQSMKWQLVVWDLRFHCRWTERVPSDTLSQKHMDGTPVLLDPDISPTPIPSRSALANIAVPTIKVPEPSSRPRLKARYNPRDRAYNTATTSRRSKRLMSKPEVLERVRQSCN